MIIEFKFENAYSFRNETVFSMLTAPIKERLFTDAGNYHAINDKLTALNTSAIYGANASGKSNFIKALSFFRNLVFESPRFVEALDINIQSFALDAECMNKPSTFEILFWWKEKLYRYGFSISRKAIEKEWLFVKEKRESEVFSREKQTFQINPKYKILADLRDKNMIHTKALLLSVASTYNDEHSKNVIEWLLRLNVISGVNDSLYRNFTIEQMRSPEKAKKIIDLIKLADFGIEDLRVLKQEAQGVKVTLGGTVDSSQIVNDKITVNEIFSKRYVKNNKGEFVLADFPFAAFESEGTQKFAHIAGPFIHTLEEGQILVIDELDTKLHPDLTERLVALFQNKELNPKNAQLIFTTHNANLMSARLLRRDQIWFTEKDGFGTSKLYSLADFKREGKKARNDEDIEKNYSLGRYGAVPFMGNFDNLLEQGGWEEK